MAVHDVILAPQSSPVHVGDGVPRGCKETIHADRSLFHQQTVPDDWLFAMLNMEVAFHPLRKFVGGLSPSCFSAV